MFSRGDVNKTPFPVDILNGGGTRIATANIHKVERDPNTSTEFRVFVYDLRFQPGVNSLSGASAIRVNQELADAAPGDTSYDATNLDYFKSLVNFLKEMKISWCLIILLGVLLEI